MSEAARFGPVQVEFRDDGTLFIYQPEPNLVLGETRTRDLIDWLVTSVAVRALIAEDGPLAQQSTVPQGVVNTSAGPASATPRVPQEMELVGVIGGGELTDTELEQDRNAAEARAAIERGVRDVEQGNVKPVPDEVLPPINPFTGERVSKPAPRRRGRPPKAKS